MSSSNWDEIRAPYHTILDHPPQDRQRVVEQHCGHDLALRKEIESLLAADAEAGEFLLDGVDIFGGDDVHRIGGLPD